MGRERPTACLIHWVTLAICICSATGTGYHVGREFVLTFMEHMQIYSTLYLRITTAETRQVNVSVNMPLMPARGTSTVTVSSNSMANVPLHIDAMLVQNSIAPKGIHVVSDGDIAVQGFNYNVEMFISSGAFLALPVLTGPSQGRYFVVAAYIETFDMTLAVTTMFPSTRVSITFRLSSGFIRLNNVNYFNGDVFQTTLNAYEALQVMTSVSMTGTQIVTNQSVSVFIGADGTKVGSVASDDYLAEQVPPVEAMGTEYVIVNFPNATDADYVIVTATEGATSYTIGGTAATLTNVGDNNLHVLSSSTLTSAVLLTSDKPVVVGQVSRSRRNTYGDPALLVLPPLARGRDSLPVGVLASELAFLTIVAEADCLPSLTLQPGSLGAWKQMTGDANLRWTMSSLSEGPQILRGAQACSRFTAHVSHWALKEGAVHPLYWSLGPFPSSSSLVVEPTSTSDVIIEAASSEVIASSSDVISSDVSSLSSTEAYAYLSSSIDITSYKDSSSPAHETVVPQLTTTQISSVFLHDSPTISFATTQDTSMSMTLSSIGQYSTSVDLLSVSETQSSMNEIQPSTNEMQPLTNEMQSSSSTNEIQSTTNDILLLMSESGSSQITTTMHDSVTPSAREATTDMTEAPSTAPSEVVTSLSFTPTASSALEFGDSMQSSPSPYQLEMTSFMSEMAASSQTAYTSASSAISPTSTTASATEVTAQFSSTTHASTKVPGQTTPGQCSCRCRQKNVTLLALASEQSAQLRQDLAVNKSLLSATRRRLESVPDQRPSAVSIGMTSIIILVVFLLTIVFPDILHGIAELLSSRSRRREVKEET